MRTLTLDALQKLTDEGRLFEAVMPVEAAFSELREIRSEGGELDKLLRNGNPFGKDGLLEPKPEEEFKVYDSAGLFIGVYGFRPEKQMFYPRKVFLGGN